MLSAFKVADFQMDEDKLWEDIIPDKDRIKLAEEEVQALGDRKAKLKAAQGGNQAVYRHLGDSNSQWHNKKFKKVPLGGSATWGKCHLGEVPLGRSATWGKCHLGDRCHLRDKNLTLGRTIFFQFCTR